MKVNFKLDRETKGTIVYAETNGKGIVLEDKKDGIIGSLYIRKTSEIGKQAPKTIVVEITAGK